MSTSKPLTPNGERLLVALYEHGTSADATDLALATGLGKNVRRHGHDAPGSWSGFQAEGFVVGRMVAALPRRGYAWVQYGHRGKCIYNITPAGRTEAERLKALGVTPTRGRDAR